MKFRILWDPAARFVFYRLPIHTAALVDRTVIRFAETGVGELTWVAPHYRLRAGFHDLILSIDPDAGAIAVLRIYRMRR